MVFGNLGEDSGTGVALHPRPGHRARGRRTATTCRTRRARTSSPASATRVPLDDLERARQGVATTSCWRSCAAWRTTTATCATSSSPSSAASCGCCRPGSASAPPAAAFRIATQLVDEGLIDLDEALRRVTGAQLAQLMFPQFDPTADARRCSTAGHGGLARVRRSARSCSTPRPRWSGPAGREGHPGPPGDQPRRPAGMIAAQGILTSRGGKTSHAAVVARGMGKTCVCGAEELDVDVERPTVRPRRTARRPRGRRHLHRRHRPARSSLGEVPVVASPVVQLLRGRARPDDAEADDAGRARCTG